MAISVLQQKAAKLITIGNFEDDLEELADIDWIIEAVVERLVNFASKTKRAGMGNPHRLFLHDNKACVVRNSSGTKTP